MMEKYVEKHHIIFYIVTIVIVFLIEQIVEKDFSDLKMTFLGLIFYIFILVVVINCLLFIFYVESVRKFLGNNYKTENPISALDILLTSPAIITIFIIDDIFVFLSPITEFAFLLTIILIPLIYLVIYKINEIFLINILSS